ncbi:MULTISPECIES: BON domain-containing protein [Xanthomonas]|uniref:Osmotically-inducible protein Y n=2 Tax=Xanthomonas TaxID=338 RepID=A0A6N7QAS7_9XANT|nr:MULTISPECIES: BON domain-containing protein [Xanthomonas]AJC47156.1 membrane protein [Xanthomonas sacchari]KAA8920779.1 BON domain-containing protein [Xanthomonas sontii]KAB7766930.1 BON domain-containing protein [Xanthomonas sp. LMG 12461]KAB7775609.1 BON domain-containing protein [Xanthomonas sp. LMG 12460]MCW0367506.1 hypothetical protein [Xanthomonas sacchari]
MKTINARTLLGATLVAGFAFGAGQAFAAGQATSAKDHGTMGQQDTMQHDTMAHDTTRHDSKEPVTDTWITTKVKADLLATKNVSGTEIKVDTVNGTVKLSGAVATKAEKDKAVAVAKKIDGVKKVDAADLKVSAAAKK